MLIEFGSEESLHDVLRSCSTHQKDVDIMALNSPFLWFRASNGKTESYATPATVLASINGIEQVDEDKLFKDLVECDTVSDQIQLLYDRTRLNDLGARLRYMVARQVHCHFTYFKIYNMLFINNLLKYFCFGIFVCNISFSFFIKLIL